MSSAPGDCCGTTRKCGPVGKLAIATGAPDAPNTMKLCYFDPFSGISGDMTVGALVDAGADWSALESSLQSLDLGATFRVEKTKRKGIAASKFTVESKETSKHRHLPHIERIIANGKLSDVAREN